MQILVLNNLMLSHLASLRSLLLKNRSLLAVGPKVLTVALFWNRYQPVHQRYTYKLMVSTRHGKQANIIDTRVRHEKPRVYLNLMLIFFLKSMKFKRREKSKIFHASSRISSTIMGTVGNADRDDSNYEPNMRSK